MTAVAVAAIAALPSAAGAVSVHADPLHPSTPPAPPPTGGQPAHISLHGVPHHLLVGKKLRVRGVVRPFVAGQHVDVRLLRKGHTVKKVSPAVRPAGNGSGTFRFKAPKLIKPGAYKVVAIHEGNAQQDRGAARSRKFRIRYPDLDPGSHGGSVSIFNRLLAHEGYITQHGSHYGRTTGYGVLAFRKANKMARTSNATPRIFKRLADGKGGYKLKYPSAGKHVEVDISRQVMTLASHGKPKYTIPVSTGAPATPTIRGHYKFYRRQPGYNSEGMYYSVYWHGGYAIHGFDPAPNYPASHGCVREPIPLAHFAYNWVKIGMSIYVYG